MNGMEEHTHTQEHEWFRPKTGSQLCSMSPGSQAEAKATGYAADILVNAQNPS